MGPHGMREVATACLRKSRYAIGKLIDDGRLALRFNQPTFKEFVLRDTTGRVEELLADALADGYFAGIPLGRWYPELADCFLVCVTEKRTASEIDGLATSIRRHGKSRVTAGA